MMKKADFGFFTPSMTVQLASVTIDGRLFLVPKYSDGSWYCVIDNLTMQFCSLSNAVGSIIRLVLKKGSVNEIKEFKAIAYDREFSSLDALYDFEMEEFHHDMMDEEEAM